MLSRRWTKVIENADSQEENEQWQPVDNEDKALALHSDVLNFQTLGRNIKHSCFHYQAFMRLKRVEFFKGPVCWPCSQAQKR